MPKLSERNFLLSQIEQQLAVAFHVEDDDEAVEDFEELYVLVNNTRYIHNRVRQPRSAEFLLSFALNLSQGEFQQCFRCDLQSLERLVEIVSLCPIFHNNSRCPQTAVMWQVCVALWRFGHNGNGSATAIEAMLFGFGVGTISLFTGRVITALLQLGGDYIVWPDEERRLEIGHVMEAEGFPRCVSFVDETTIPLVEKSSLNGDCYWDRKCRYLINLQIVCDVNRRIIGFSCGKPGSMHDVGVWRQSVQAMRPHEFFSKGQYLLGDSAYGVSSFLLPAYKSPAADPAVNREFNYLLAKSRVRNEHCIGILKGRWSCLREHRRQIRALEDVESVICTSIACIILHNMLANLGDFWDELFREDDPIDLCLVEDGGGCDQVRGHVLRERVKVYAIQKGYLTGKLPIVG